MKMSNSQKKNFINHLNFMRDKFDRSKFNSDNFIEPESITVPSNINPYRLVEEDFKGDYTVCYIGALVLNPDIPKPKYDEDWGTYSNRVIGINENSFNNIVYNSLETIITYFEMVSKLIGKVDFENEEDIVDIINFYKNNWNKEDSSHYYYIDKYLEN